MMLRPKLADGRTWIEPYAKAMRWVRSHRMIVFDRFALELTRGSLRQDYPKINLPLKAFEVLCHLAEKAGRLVPKDEP